MGAYNYPFSAEKFKVRGEIATDDDSVIFLPPILWEKVLIENRKREERKISNVIKKLFTL